MERRLDRVNRALGGESRHQVAICEEHEWPPAAWAALIAADERGDLARVADLAARYAGVRPVFGGPFTAIIFSHSGPPSDRGAAVRERP